MREALIVAQKADVVILCMGLNASMEGEEGDAFNGDNSGDKKDIELPSSQKKLYQEIKKLHKPMIFVNVSGSAINLCEQDRDCNAVLQCFYPGAEGGRALADILFGRVSPSGKLPVTFYRSTEDLPPFEDYSMKNRTYRFFTGKPLYQFGYGLSYTKFDYTNFEISDGKAAVTVKNIGAYDGAEVVQLYRRTDCLTLVGFQKIALKKGESVRVEFEVDSTDGLFIREGSL